MDDAVTGRDGGLSRRTLLKGVGAVAGTFGLVAIAEACAPAATPAGATTAGAQLTPRRGGTVTYASSSELTTLDPPNTGDFSSVAALNLMYEGLVSYTPDLVIKPALATGWETKDNTWTFKLRTGVKFHDGTPFNAAAVKANIDRFFTGDKPLRTSNWTTVIERMDVVDDQTVRFVTKGVNAFFLTTVADNSGYIVSPDAIKKFGKDLSKNAVGTGPFKFSEWIKDERFVAVRNDDYWGDKAYLDKVVIRALPEAESRVIALEAGDVQLAIRVNPEQIERIRKNPALAIDLKPTTRHLFMGLACLKKPFSDVRVRQALNHAIDKQAITKNLYLDTADVMGGAVPPGAQGFAAPPPFPYDVAKAKQLLADAGYPGGFTATLIGPKGAYLKDFELQQAVQQYLKAVGVTINIQTVEFAKYLDLIREDPKKSALEMWQDANGGNDASNAITGRYACDKFRPIGANTAGFCDSKLDDLAYKAVVTIDEAPRNALLKEAQLLVAQDAPSIWLVVLKEAAALSAKLHAPVHYQNSVVTVDEHTWIEA